MNNKNQERVINKFRMLLEKMGVSGIFHFPTFGTISFFSTDGERLLCLEHAKIEIEKDIQINKVKASQWALERVSQAVEKKPNQTYAG